MPSPLRLAGFAVCLLAPASGCVKTKPLFTHAPPPRPIVGTSAPSDKGRVLYVVSDAPGPGEARTLTVLPKDAPAAPVMRLPLVPTVEAPVIPPPAGPSPSASEVPAQDLAGARARTEPATQPAPDVEARIQALQAERQAAVAEAERLAKEKQALAAQLQQMRQAMTAQQQTQPPPADPIPPPSAAYLTHLLLAEKDLRLKEVQLESARQQAMAAYQVLAARGHAVPGPVIADFGRPPAAPGPVTNLLAPLAAAGCRACNPHNPAGVPGGPAGNPAAGPADPNAGVVKLY